jgi:hypothetical protein
LGQAALQNLSSAGTLLAAVCCLALAVLLTLPADGAPDPGATDWADCLACHQQYADDLPRLSQLRPTGLGNQLGESCFSCHSAADMSPRGSAAVHPVRSVGSPGHLSCIECHPAVPHGTDQPPPRPRGDYRADACLSCHNDVDTKLHLLSSHRVGTLTPCITCHPPHKPLQAALPRPLLPPDVADAFDAAFDPQRSNGSCLGCHSMGLLTMRLDQGFVTLNTENYHDLHVVRSGILCIECHDPHGAPRDALMRPTLLTGELLGYRPTGRGATCSVTCHGVEHANWEYVNTIH